MRLYKNFTLSMLSYFGLMGTAAAVDVGTAGELNDAILSGETNINVTQNINMTDLGSGFAAQTTPELIITANGSVIIDGGGDGTSTGGGFSGFIVNNNTMPSSKIAIGDNMTLQNFYKAGNGAIIHNLARNTDGEAEAVTTIGNNVSILNTYTNNFNAVIYSAANGSTKSTSTVNIGNNVLFQNNTSAGYGTLIINGVVGAPSSAEGEFTTTNIGDNVKFIDNTSFATSGNRHGVILYQYVENSSGDAISGVNIGDNVLVSGNTIASNSGSGIFHLFTEAYNDKTASTVVNIGKNSVFKDNQAGGGGGIIDMFTTADNGKIVSQINIGDNATFTNNSTRTGTGGVINYIVRNKKDATDVISEINIFGSALFSGNTDGTGNNDISITTASALAAGELPPANINILGGLGHDVTFNGGISSGQDTSDNVAINHTGSNNLIFGKDAQNINYYGAINQNNGTLTFYGEAFEAAIASNLNGGLVKFLGDGQNLNNTNFNGAAVSSINDVVNTTNFIGTTNISKASNFSIDLNPLTGEGDKFNIAALGTAGGNFNLSGLNMLSDLTQEVVDFEVFTGDIAGANFTSAPNYNTPIYLYSLKSLQNEGEAGSYRLTRLDFNPLVYRGQVAQNAMYLNQQRLTETVFDHVYLDSNKNGAPWQFAERQSGAWVKIYGSNGDFTAGRGLKDVDNDAYGVIAGVDLPTVELGNEWQFLPTFFAAYNNSNQKYASAKMEQTGGQGGFMGTFAKGDFISSVMAYAGGYENDMKFAGHKDNADSWFAWTALKTAYNFRPVENVVIQPNVLVSYASFQAQKWDSSYGDLAMKADELDGTNVAPGVNVIFGRQNWNVNAGVAYVYGLDGKVKGSAGDIETPYTNTDNSFMRYSLGAVIQPVETLFFDAQVGYDKGNKTNDISGQIGMTFRF